MPYGIRNWQKIPAEIRRIAREQIDRAIAELDGKDGEAEDLHAAIHQARKRMKKIRALLRLVRPHIGKTYARENAFYRDLARGVSQIRDAEAFVDTTEALGRRFSDQIDATAWEEIRSAFARRRDRIAAADAGTEDAATRLVRELKKGRRRIRSWPLDRFDAAPQLAPEALLDGMLVTYRRARHAMPAAFDHGSAAAFHEWRKRVKYHWYHIRIVRDLWIPVLEAFGGEASELADILGDGHDLDALEAFLGDDCPQAEDETLSPSARAFLLALTARRRDSLRARARPLGMQLLAEKPKALRKRLAAYAAAAT
ncbi:CHAD domain-containing protein [soil metagenome]